MGHIWPLGYNYAIWLMQRKKYNFWREPMTARECTTTTQVVLMLCGSSNWAQHAWTSLWSPAAQTPTFLQAGQKNHLNRDLGDV